jgi:hypothetical protein
MMQTASARYTLEFKPVALPTLKACQGMVGVARTLGVVDQPLLNGVKAQHHWTHSTHTAM